MELTRQQAIDLSLELWTWLEETGKKKEDWPGWVRFEGRVNNRCFLCEYDVKQVEGDSCEHCPYQEAFGECCDDDAPFQLWDSGEDEEERKKYAQQFLDQLKQLK